jgi:hypothetical protein
MVALISVVANTGAGFAQEIQPDTVNQTSEIVLGSDAQADEASPFGVMGECHVDSRVGVYIRVYINGVYRGTIRPGGDIFPFVGDSPNGVTTLYACSEDGRLTWNRTLYGSYSSFQWVLYP